MNPRSRRFRVAILGTFDLQNYGDLLFPLLARHELTRRLKDVEVVPFSYHRRDVPDWPYEVLPTESLPGCLHELDAVLVGGGHIVRFDREVAPGYEPPSADLHHPTGIWLVPAMLAALAGRPVIWNGIGASPDVEDWAAELLSATLRASDYIAVRDGASKATLRTFAEGAEVTVVPDSAFGVAALLGAHPDEQGLRRWRREHGLEGPYVVVQATLGLAGVAADLRTELEALADRGHRILELPIGPVLDDRPGVVAPDWEAIVRVEEWPSPLLLTRLVAESQAAIGVSLHLGIAALCHGVPLHRPRCSPGSKYEILGGFPGVYQFDEQGRGPRVELRGRTGRRDASAEIRRQQELLVRHWDRVAEIVAAGSHGVPEAAARFIFRLPWEMEAWDRVKRQAADGEGRLQGDRRAERTTDTD